MAWQTETFEKETHIREPLPDNFQAHTWMQRKRFGLEEARPLEQGMYRVGYGSSRRRRCS